MRQPITPSTQTPAPADPTPADPTPEDLVPPDASRPGLALFTLATGQLMIIVDVTVVTIAVPLIRTDLHFSTTGLSWVLNAYLIAFGGLLLLGGRLGDLIGRRRTLRAGIALFTAASLLAGCAPSAGWLLAARGLQGVGGALASPSVLALIATVFTGQRRVRAMAVFSTVTGVGLAGGLMVGGALTEWASWRWVFWINVPIGMLLIGLLPRAVPQQPGRPGRLDVAGAVSGTATAAAVVYTVIRAAGDGWGDRWTLAVGVTALAALVTFVLVERRAPEPILPGRLLTDRLRTAAYLVVLGMPAAMFGVFFFLGQYLQFVRGANPLQTGLAYLPLALAQLGTLRLTPRLLARLGPTWLVTTGVAMAAVSTGWLSLLTTSTSYVSGVLGPMLLLGTGVGLAFLPLNIVIVTGAGPDSGAASGLLQTLQQIGGALGLAVLVTVYDHASTGQTGPTALTHGAAAGFRTAAAIALVTTVFAAVGLRKRSERSAVADPGR